MNRESALVGGASHRGVVRVGGTVRRPPGPAAALVREVLQRLEHVGFDAAPRWLGFDEQGRDVLSWVEGETLVDRGRLHPYIDDSSERIVFSDRQLAAVFRLLRRYHDAFGGEVICHGDYGPWNLVWREGMPVAILDFDCVHRGEPADDVAYALRMFVSYGLAASEPDEALRRTRAALDAYGAGFDVPALLAREYARAEENCRRNGWDRQLEKLRVERAWLAANGERF